MYANKQMLKKMLKMLNACHNARENSQRNLQNQLFKVLEHLSLKCKITLYCVMVFPDGAIITQLIIFQIDG